MTDPATAAAVAGVVKGGANIKQAQAEKGRTKETNEDNRTREMDLSQRREATYRTERERLNAAIDDFYGRVGVKPPPRTNPQPGAYTTRPLSEDELLQGYDKEDDVFGVIPQPAESTDRVEKPLTFEDGNPQVSDPKKIQLIKKLASELEKNGTKR